MEKHLTQKELVELLNDRGIPADRPKVSKWERGKHMPAADTAGAIARVLGVRFEDIWKVEEKHP